MGKRSIGMFRIAGAYIGTVVGAGFSSGQEILRFFTAHGMMSLWGIVVAVVLFFFFGLTALLLGKALNARSHLEVVRFTNGRVLGGVIDIIITVFLFGGFGVMIAGAGAVFHEQFSLGPVWGMLIMAIASLITVMTGTKGVVNAISAVVPLLIFMVVFVFIMNALKNPLTPEEIEASKAVAAATPNWFLSAVNYAAYNLVTAIAVLAPIGANVQKKSSLLGGAILGAIGLGIGILGINFCLMTNISDVAALEVPMIAISAKIAAGVRLLFAVVIFTEIYSTAIGDLYGFSQRISFSLPKKLLIALTTAGAFAAGQMGFSNLVRILYPAVGYGALLFFAGAIYAWIKKRDKFL